MLTEDVQDSNGRSNLELLGSTIIEVTGHSTLETQVLCGRKVVIKRCRRISDSKTIDRFRGEVKALEIVGEHVGVA
jgi:hypothetical protein